MNFKFSSRSLIKRSWIKCSNQRNNSNIAENNREKHLLTDLKRGTGGRSSFSGLVVTVFGARCPLGRATVNQLGKIGSQIIIPYRGDPYDYKDLKLMGDLGQVLFIPYHIENESQIRKAIQHSNVVINLAGKWNETKNFSFHSVNVDSAQRLARISRECGVQKFIHVSAMGADSKAPTLLDKKGADFLRTKGLGEEAVLSEFSNAIIFRPSYMWGQMDNFLFYFISMHRHSHSNTKVKIPLWRCGDESVKMPVHVHDVGRALALAACDRDFGREPAASTSDQIVQAVGPHAYRLRDLITWIFMHTRYEAAQIKISRLEYSLLYWLKLRFQTMIQAINPPLTPAKLEFECHSDLVDPSLLTLDDLGLKLTKLEDQIAWELKPFLRFAYYWDALGEFPKPPNPPLFVAEES